MLPRLILLGVPRLETPSHSFALSAGKRAALLAYVGYQGGWVERESLLALFWPETSEHQARGNLRQLLSTLTHSPYAAPLEIARRSVRWRIATDVGAFREALRGGDFESALEYVAGPLLEGFDTNGLEAFEAWLLDEREVLSRQLRHASLEHARALRAENGHAQAGAVLEKYLRHEPLDELVVGALLDALLGAGQHRYALSVFEGFRRRLAREVSGEPEREILELVTRIRRAEADLYKASIQDAPTHSATPPLATTTLGALVGRVREQRLLRERLADPSCRLLTLRGPGGIGKTRLAQVVAAACEQAGVFRDGVSFAALESLATPDLLAPHLAERLGLTLRGTGPPERRLSNALEGLELLLVLDAFEGMMAGTALLSSLLGGAPGLKLLVTSRERLDLPAEQVFDLQGLALTPADAEVRSSEAAQLFMQSARRAGATFQLTEETRKTVAAICTLLDGSPLALELTSAWVRVLTPAEILAELHTGLDLLITVGPGGSARHRSMRLVLEYAWAKLSTAEREALDKLSVFRGGFTYAAAKAVVGLELSALLTLVDRSLLYRAADDRFALHELVRQYAAERLVQAGGEADARARHARYYLALLGALPLWNEDEEGALLTLGLELENLRKAWEWGVRTARLPELLPPHDLVVFFDRRARFEEGLELFDAAAGLYDAVRPEHAGALASLLVDRAWLLFRLGRYAEALPLATRSLTLTAEAEHAKTRMKAHNTLGLIARYEGRYETARGHIEAALGLAQGLGEWRRAAAYLNNLAATHITLGHYEQAEAASHAALNLHRAADDAYGVVATFVDLSNLYHRSERPQAALEAADKALELAQTHAFTEVLGVILLSRALALYQADDFEEAKAGCHAALEQITETGDAWNRATALTLLGRIATAQGEFAEARRSLMEGLLTAWTRRETPGILECMIAIGDLELREGAPERAYRLLYAAAHHPATQPWDRPVAERLLSAALPSIPLERRQHSETEVERLEAWVPMFLHFEPDKLP